jgi:hypothetical protein
MKKGKLTINLSKIIVRAENESIKNYFLKSKISF